MFSHVTVGTGNIARSRDFFDAVFAPLGYVLRHQTDESVSYHAPDSALPFFTALLPIDDADPSPGNGAMTAFLAPTRKAVDECYAAAVRLAATCEGPPGLRPHYHASYYGAYFRDPDGNKLHVVCHEAEA